MAAQDVFILIAEDDADDRFLLQTAFEENGFAERLKFVENGVEVMEFLNALRTEESRPHLLPRFIILDLNMPKKDGREVLKEIYRPLFLNRAPILFTARRTAELTKYAANAFLAVKISFINEIADLCEAVDADVQDVARGIGLDNRIGPKFLHAGPGYGGSCFPKDTLALLKTADAVGVDQRIVRTTVAVNDDRKASMADRVERALGGSVSGKNVAVLGLAFKPNTDDMRDAPSIPLINGLLERGAKVSAYDPVARQQAEQVLSGITFVDNAYAAAADADALVIVTEWDEFRALDLDKVAASMRGKVLVDLRNVYDRDEAEGAGLAYHGVGRGRVQTA
jgi:UDPglucose 6-dehydrogenase